MHSYLVYTGTLIFTEEELNKATDNFSLSRLLGQGGFGQVYKGFVRHTTVAVKLLTKVKNDGI